MTQHEAYKLLKDNPKRKFDSKEMATIMGISSGSIANSLSKLKKHAKFFPHFRFKIEVVRGYRRFVYWYDPNQGRPCKEEIYL